MIIKVLFFAQLKDTFGTGERIMEVPEETTVAKFVQFLFEETGVAHLKRLPLLYSVDEDFADENRVLKDRDTLALIPPVAGG